MRSTLALFGAAAVGLTLVLGFSRGAVAAGPDGRSGTARSVDPVAQAEVGYLTLETDPKATLYLDGETTGRPTPVTKLPLSVGKHKLRLVTLDGKIERTLGVQIARGEEKHVNVNL